MQEEIFKAGILRVLKDDDYTPMKLSRLARELGVTDEDYPHFKAAFEKLRAAGHIVIGQGKAIDLKPIGQEVIGTFRANPKGFGFVIPLEPNAHGDLFIPPDGVGQAMTGDVVVARVQRRGRRGGQERLTGRIVEIRERARNRFVGTLARQGKRWMVMPDGSAFIEPIVVEDVTAKNARADDKVVVEILRYPDDGQLAEGVILDVLGKAGLYESEIQSVICQYHLATDFNEECLEQARRAAAEFDPDRADDREDITDRTVVTIDPPDAKDFDDAISLERDAQGHWVLGVHIADVSAFIEEGSPLDEEARQRGNSVYLPRRTLPMLPEILSNGICSLQPNQPRFAKSVYITYDDQGRILSRRYANSLIRSSQRLTYLQADAILRGRPLGDEVTVGPEVRRLVKNMETLARAIEARRRERGMLHLALREIELIYDDEGQVVDAEPADDCYPHTIIEMFMVEANDAVADLLDRRNIPFMRRIHPDPSPMSFKTLQRLLKAFGLGIPDQPDRQTLQDLLASVAGTEHELAVNLAVLRSFEKAVYSPLNVGHYALASTHYCHFTSPIRRYADLMVHRMLQRLLEKRPDEALRDAANLDLAEIGRHLSFTERRAEDAERELTTVLLLQMLSKRVGEDLDCVVTGLTGFGVFVQCRTFGIEGLIRLNDLGPDQWRFDDKTQRIVGERSGVTLKLGQPLTVRIASVSVPARQLNVVPTEPLTTTGPGRKSRGQKKRPRQATKATNRRSRPSHRRKKTAKRRRR